MAEQCTACGKPLLEDGSCADQTCRNYVDQASKSQSQGGDDFDRLGQLFQMRKNGELDAEFVTICGFPTAGKSWLSYPLARAVSRREGWDIMMDEKWPERDYLAMLEGTIEIGQTFDLLIHHFFRDKGNPGRNIVLIDIPGEYFKNLLVSRDTSRINPAMLAAFAMTDRLVLTIPSDVCVIGTLLHCALKAQLRGERGKSMTEIRDRNVEDLENTRAELFRKVEAMRGAGEHDPDLLKRFEDASLDLDEKLLLDQWVHLDWFAEDMHRVFGQAAYVKAKFGDKLFETPHEEWLSGLAGSLGARMGSLDHLCAQSYAVLTKADRVLPLLTGKNFGYRSQNGEREPENWKHQPERREHRELLERAGWRKRLGRLVGDPRMIVAHLQPNLLARLDRWLPDLRYDWAAASWSADDFSITMDVDDHSPGVQELCDWIIDGPARSPHPEALHAKLRKLRAGAERNATRKGSRK